MGKLLIALASAGAGAIGAWFFLNAKLGERLRAREADNTRLAAPELVGAEIILRY